jgi:hypothetical protein
MLNKRANGLIFNWINFAQGKQILKEGGYFHITCEVPLPHIASWYKIA